MRGKKATEWESRLKAVFDEIDLALETRYAHRFPLHPARSKHGKTGNCEMDGLFNVGASFSAGFGSRFGPGYVVDIRVATLKQVDRKLRNELRDVVLELLREKLPGAFPNKKLYVDKERHYLRIHGDLSLD